MRRGVSGDAEETSKSAKNALRGDVILIVRKIWLHGILLGGITPAIIVEILEEIVGQHRIDSQFESIQSYT